MLKEMMAGVLLVSCITTSISALTIPVTTENTVVTVTTDGPTAKPEEPKPFSSWRGGKYEDRTSTQAEEAPKDTVTTSPDRPSKPEVPVKEDAVYLETGEVLALDDEELQNYVEITQKQREELEAELAEVTKQVEELKENSEPVIQQEQSVPLFYRITIGVLVLIICIETGYILVRRKRG